MSNASNGAMSSRGAPPALKHAAGVDWSIYAREYDLLVSHSPEYQDLLEHCVTTVRGWPLQRGTTIADFGAGTGNVSIALAEALPHVHVLHVERDAEMLRLATAKAAARDLANWSVVAQDLDDPAWDLPPLGGAVTINALYPLRHPERVIGRIVDALEPGGHVYACDFGRRMNVWDWGCHLLVAGRRRYGLWRMLRVLLSTREAQRQNARIAVEQDAGSYWRHDLQDFQKAFADSRARVYLTSSLQYRGYNDLVVAVKPC